MCPIWLNHVDCRPNSSVWGPSSQILENSMSSHYCNKKIYFIELSRQNLSWKAYWRMDSKRVCTYQTLSSWEIFLYPFWANQRLRRSVKRCEECTVVKLKKLGQEISVCVVLQIQRSVCYIMKGYTKKLTPPATHRSNNRNPECATWSRHARHVQTHHPWSVCDDERHRED